MPNVTAPLVTAAGDLATLPALMLAATLVGQETFTVPAGSWEYKATLNDSWDENYGANAERNGPNIPLNLSADTDVKFYYSHATHWVIDNVHAVIATVLIAGTSLHAAAPTVTSAAKSIQKPRIIVTSDGEIDDECSMVRFLLAG